jgi:hypothetical protein
MCFAHVVYFFTNKEAAMVNIVVSLTSSAYHYSSFSELPYFKKVSIFYFLFYEAKMEHRLAFSKKRLTDFSANSLV